MKRIILFFFVFYSSLLFSQSFIDFYFRSKEVDGGIIIYNQNNDSWLFNNESDIKRQTPIGSLFNIPNALIALDLGIITNSPNNFMYWDGVKRYYFGYSNPYWNCNTNLDEALQHKTDWYFQNVSEKIGFRNYEFFLKRLEISNLNFNWKEKYFWHFGGLKSTPLQQIDFFRKLKDQQIILFQKKYQKDLFDSLLAIYDKDYQIHFYETYDIFKGERIDWWVGVLETKNNKYYFSTRVYESVNKQYLNTFRNKKYEITLEIFRVLGYI